MLKYTALLIEDNQMNAEIMQRRLEKRGFHVIIREDGRDLFILLQQVRPDVILMDLSLPYRNGWALTGDLKNNPATADIPVIAVTAHAMVGDREKALEAGCDEYESKPVDFTRLFEKIDSLLRVTSGRSR